MDQMLGLATYHSHQYASMQSDFLFLNQTSRPLLAINKNIHWKSSFAVCVQQSITKPRTFELRKATWNASHIKYPEYLFNTSLHAALSLPVLRAGNVHVENLDGWDTILSSLSTAVSLHKTQQALCHCHLREIPPSRRTQSIYQLRHDEYKHATLLHVSQDNLWLSFTSIWLHNTLHLLLVASTGGRQTCIALHREQSNYSIRDCIEWLTDSLQFT